jgi:hypothetical protein
MTFCRWLRESEGWITMLIQSVLTWKKSKERKVIGSVLFAQENTLESREMMKEDIIT